MIRKLRLRRLSLCAVPALALLWAPDAEARDGAPDRVLYIRARFDDVAPYTTRESQWFNDLAAADAEASSFWDHNTYGLVDGFDSSITEVFNLGASSRYDNNGSTRIGLLATDMRNAAASAGWNLADVDTFVYSFPDPADIGAGALGSPGNIWMPAFPFAGGLTHEYGHALALGHANLYEGGSEVYPGVHREGRDGLYMLGSEGGVQRVDGLRAPINLPMRDKIGAVPDGLIDYGVAPSLLGQTVTETHRVYDFNRTDISGDLAAGRKLGVTFEYDRKQWYVSFAPSLAQHWSAQNGSGWANGIAVHELQGDITRGLDFTPGSQGGSGNEEDYVDSRDGALVVGSSYSFPTSGGVDVTLAPLATGFDGDGVKWIDVQITKTTPGVTPDPGPFVTLQNADFTADNWTSEENFVSNGGIGGNLSGWTAEGVVRGMNLDVDGDGDPTADSGPQVRRWNGWQTGDALRQIGFQNSGDAKNAIFQDVSVFEEGAEYTFSIDLAPGFENASQDGFVQILRASDGQLLAETTFDAVFSSSSTTSTQSVSYTATGDDLGSRIRVRFGADSGGSGTSAFSNPVLEVMRQILAGDYNNDGVVDAGDYTVWRDSVGSTSGPLAADGDNDGDVDLDDYNLWRNNYGATTANPTPQQSATVPEPSTAVSCGVIVLLASVRRRMGRGRSRTL